MEYLFTEILLLIAGLWIETAIFVGVVKVLNCPLLATLDLLVKLDILVCDPKSLASNWITFCMVGKLAKLSDVGKATAEMGWFW